MAPRLVDPLAALKEDRAATQAPSAAQIVKAAKKTTIKERKAGIVPASAPMDLGANPAGSTALTPISQLTLKERCQKDFRVFLTLVWRHCLGVDPSPIQLDMAHYLQHGPSRTIIMAFRGFSKSWITGAYALWRLLVNPDEKILVVSGSMKRATATTNWCLGLIMQMDILADMRPRPTDRQSSVMFDVGNCNPAQSASFMAAGIGGQLVGFRGTCIIPDDVETQTNSLTVVMREKIREAVKEFESVLTPEGVIKYLGTPHDSDSLYTYLLGLRDVHGRAVYEARIWPALFPTEKQIKGYGAYLAPYITGFIRKHGHQVVGHSTMPNRFTDDNLETRRAAIGNSEFALQFMLDLSASFTDKYPLKVRDLIVADLDDEKGPEDILWGNSMRDVELPVMGFDGDYYHLPAHIGDAFSPYQRVIAYVDTSGTGTDETVCTILAYHYGRIFVLGLYASTKGYAPEVLDAMAALCVRFRAHELFEEVNYGGGMFGELLKPYLQKAWSAAERAHRGGPNRRQERSFGTRIEPVTASNRAAKEQRILAILEPVVQQHRLVVSRAVVLWDERSLKSIEGEDSRHRYALGYQFTHITKEKDCLGKDDRVDCLAGGVSVFAEMLGVDPGTLASGAREDRLEDEIRRLFEEEDEIFSVGHGKKDSRVEASRPTKR